MNVPPLFSWPLPMDRPHNGIPLANGVQGLLIHGDTSILLTIGRLGFWDRRGGNPFRGRTTYAKVQSLLRRGDEDGLKEVFGLNDAHDSPLRPHQVGGGRLEIPLPEGWSLQSASLDPLTATVTLVVGNGQHDAPLRIRQCVAEERTILELPPMLNGVDPLLLPSWHWIRDKLSATGCEAPDLWRRGAETGFIQRLPEDDPLAVRAITEAGRMQIVTAVGPDALDRTSLLLREDPAPALEETDAWWRNYWQDVPRIDLPDPVLQEQVDYGLYLQACCTPPQGLACTLQGALMECEKLPPWSNDFHLNINLQMIYTPALATNRPAHFRPLWDRVRAWLPDLQSGGAAFFEDDEALMLPHAVDDRCQVVGAFWTGSIDHACTAWMALLCADYCRYSGDRDLLASLAWPLLAGAWAGFRAMLEEDEDGHLHLPVSVSPEYKGARMDAWGADSSFQLAALHAVLRELPRAAAQLDRPRDPAWADAAARIPPFTSEIRPRSDENPEQTHERIVLWRGQDLDGSHRHHSHLAGLTPFRTLDPRGEHADILRHSLEWWTRRGPGAWSGWCVPWAASIHARCGHPDAAVHWLHTWNRAFTTRGRASLHDADFPGFSTLAAPEDRPHDIMQLDGRFGALSAVLELLMQDWNDEVRLLPALPRDWTDFSFDGILAPGGFLLGAEVVDRRIVRVRVQSPRGGTLRLRIGQAPLRELHLLPGREKILEDLT